jgi:hypothetical protein
MITGFCAIELTANMIAVHGTACRAGKESRRRTQPAAKGRQFLSSPASFASYLGYRSDMN